MSKQKSKEELIRHKENALKCLDNYLTNLIQSNNPILNSKSDKLSYWIEDYTRFISFESNFQPEKLKRYKRGDIIQVHLGYKIGSEEGGLHYAVVIDKNNSIYSPVVTIVPLTSIKKNKDLNNLRVGEINLGDELYTLFKNKFITTKNNVQNKIEINKSALDNLPKDIPAYNLIAFKLQSDIEQIGADIEQLEKINKEILKMKLGSIALVNQITTISKIRIKQPKTKYDVLNEIRLSHGQLDAIDDEIKHLYIKNI